jgi:hypothetical protein
MASKPHVRKIPRRPRAICFTYPNAYDAFVDALREIAELRAVSQKVGAHCDQDGNGAVSANRRLDDQLDERSRFV